MVEPYAAELPPDFKGTGAKRIDINTALEQREILIPLVDHDVFRSVPLAERGEKLVYDTRGIWPDQPSTRAAGNASRRVSLSPMADRYCGR